MHDDTLASDIARAATVASGGRHPIVTPDADPAALSRTRAPADPSLAATLVSGEPAPPTGDDDTRDGAAGPRRAAIPRRLGRYHVLERLGAGGMGTVYAAYDPDLDRKVAVKLLHAGRGEDSQLRLLREAQALARLSHPNVVQIHDASVVGEQIFIAMEFVRGQDLRAWLLGQLRSEREILGAFLDAGRGLAAAHAEGLVHRDFKPENVLVGADGRVRVADFGLARAGDGDAPPAPAAPAQGPLDVSLTATGALLGTPAYMSPEQLLGLRADARSDQFAFCVALWEALYHQRPFGGASPGELILAVQAGAVRPPPDGARVPRRVELALRRGLLPQPERRHPDMPALLAALERDPSRARRRALAGAALFAMSTGTAFLVADHRAAEAAACTGGAAELAAAWDDARRAEVTAALPDADLAARVVAGLDRYAAGWVAAHRDACLDRRRGELSDVRFDARARCLDRRRLALGSAAAALVARAPDPAALVAHLPSLAPCLDAATDLSEATLPEDPVLAGIHRDLDARLIDARAAYHAGDLAGAKTRLDPVIAEARRRDLRALLAEALLLHAALREAEFDSAGGRDAAAEAAAHALATRRDDLAAEALARRVFFDGTQNDLARALADAPIARAVAERLPDPTDALVRIDHNLGFLHLFVARDPAAARPHLERAAAGLAREPAGDPIEHASAWMDIAVADPAARPQAFARATALLEDNLGEHHPRSLALRKLRAEHAPDARAAADLFAATCPALLAQRPASPGPCAYCTYELGHVRLALGQTDDARAAFADVDRCLGDTLDAHRADQLTALHERAAAFAALAADQPLAALAHADAALAITTPHAGPWWVEVELAEIRLARGQALAALARPDDARAALALVLPVLEDISKSRDQLLDRLWLDRARFTLAALP